MSFRHEPRHSPITWLVVADRAHARIFQCTQPEVNDLRELKSLVHEESACHSRDVYTDRPGRFAGNSGECVAGDPETDFKHQTATTFACQVAEELDRGRMHNEFGSLVIFAPALFLGILREHLSRPLAKLVIAESNKELVHASVDELRQQLHAILAELQPVASER